MDAINPTIATMDVLIGANDVVNPAAREVRSSPIYGMPIINVDEARSVFVLKPASPGRRVQGGLDNLRLLENQFPFKSGTLCCQDILKPGVINIAFIDFDEVTSETNAYRARLINRIMNREQRGITPGRSIA